MLGDARNAGLERAHTPYVFFLDADDRLLSGTLGAQAAVLDADPGIAACSARVMILNEADGVERRGHWPEDAAVQRSAHERRFALWLLHSAQVPIVSSLIRTDVARDAGGFPGRELLRGLAVLDLARLPRPHRVHRAARPALHRP